MSNLEYYLAFSYFLNIGPFRLGRLVKKFGSIKKAYEARYHEMTDIISIDSARKFDTFRRNFDPIKELKRLNEKEIKVVSKEDKYYPEQLKHFEDAPICIFIKGNEEVIRFPHEKYFAVVGTRKPSQYGLQVARELSRELAIRGFVIVSGMALGIDGAAHKAALSVQGITVAVLGSGVDIVYPSSHRYLYNQIIRNGGAIISEFAPWQQALPGLFVARNRIISGLSHGILVVEGKKDSGALITGRNGIEQDKNVYAIPGSPTNQKSQAPNILIQEGAYLVKDLSDIFIKYGINVSKRKRSMRHAMTPSQKSLYLKLLKQSLSADELALEVSRPIYEVLSDLSYMELQQDVERNNEGKYQII